MVKSGHIAIIVALILFSITACTTKYCLTRFGTAREGNPFVSIVFELFGVDSGLIISSLVLMSALFVIWRVGKINPHTASVTMLLILVLLSVNSINDILSAVYGNSIVNHFSSLIFIATIITIVLWVVFRERLILKF